MPLKTLGPIGPRAVRERVNLVRLTVDSKTLEAWDLFNCLKLYLELQTTRAFPAVVSPLYFDIGIAQFQLLIQY
jgi:hypothetical protein